MSEAKKYPYATGSLLDERNTYYYSEYGGAAFLEAWREDRNLAWAVSEMPEVKAVSLPKPDTPVETANLLEAVLYTIENEDIESKTGRHWLRLLVKKFEVTKRIHARYDASFRAVDKSECRDMALYVRLAEVFERAYARWQALPYLNALLKCLDTLCSQKNDLPEGLTGRLAGLIQCEQRHVANVAEGLGVRMP